MWDLIVSVPDHCLSFYFSLNGGVNFNIMTHSNQCHANNSFL